MVDLTPTVKSGTAEEISSVALAMLHKYPSDAVSRAEARYDGALSRGKVDLAIRWWRIKEAILKLRSLQIERDPTKPRRIGVR
jgi:hypothetical protein